MYYPEIYENSHSIASQFTFLKDEILMRIISIKQVYAHLFFYSTASPQRTMQWLTDLREKYLVGLLYSQEI